MKELTKNNMWEAFASFFIVVSLGVLEKQYKKEATDAGICNPKI